MYPQNAFFVSAGPPKAGSVASTVLKCLWPIPHQCRQCRRAWADGLATAPRVYSTRRAMHAALMNACPQSRRMLLLQLTDGLSCAETAVVIDLPEPIVRFRTSVLLAILAKVSKELAGSYKGREDRDGGASRQFAG